MTAEVDARRTAYFLLTLMAICFGGTWVAGKVAVNAIPPMTLAATRFTLASLLLWVWARTQRGTTCALTRRDLPLVLGMGLTAVAAYNVLFLYGLRLAPASDGAIIVPGMAPILAAALAWLVLGERIGRWGAAGLVTALIGLALVIGPSGGSGSSRFVGDVLFLLGAACWAVYAIMGKAATARFSAVSATTLCHIYRDSVVVAVCPRRGGMEFPEAGTSERLDGSVVSRCAGYGARVCPFL